MDDDVAFKPAEPFLPQKGSVQWWPWELKLRSDAAEALSPEPPLIEFRVPDSFPAPGDDGGIRGEHFLSVLRDFGDVDALRSPHVETVFPREEFLDVCRTYRVSPDDARGVEDGSIPYANAIRDGALRRLRMWAENFDIVEDDIPLQFGNPLPIAELHCPRVEGAKTWLRHARSAERELKLDVTLGALGGGGTFKRSFEVSAGVTSSGRCQALVAEVSGSASVWRHLDTGETIYLLSITNVSAIWSAQPIPDGDPRRAHICSEERDLAAIKDGLVRRRAVVDVDYLHVLGSAGGSAGAVVDGRLKMSDERVYQALWRIAPANLAGDVGTITITSKFKHEVEWGFEFTQGPEFLGTYPSPRRWPVHWAWHQP